MSMERWPKVESDDNQPIAAMPPVDPEQDVPHTSIESFENPSEAGEGEEETITTTIKRGVKYALVGAIVATGSTALYGYLRVRQQYDIDSALSVDATKQIKGLDQLDFGSNPLIRKSKADQPLMMSARLHSGKTCEFPYVSHATGLWKIRLFSDNKATLIIDSKTGLTDTGTCPPVYKAASQPVHTKPGNASDGDSKKSPTAIPESPSDTPTWHHIKSSGTPRNA